MHECGGEVEPCVSVISVSHNRCGNTRELLTAIKRQTFRPFEVILVDNASTDGTPDMVRSEFPEVHLIETGGNPGQTAAYNLGFRSAHGEYFLVMDDDGLPAADDWIEQVVSRFEANPRLAVVSCTIRMRDTGRIAYDSPQFAPYGQGDKHNHGLPGVVFNGTGAGLRAEALRRGCSFPSYFFSTYLELHLCTALLDAGWEVRHFPEIEVWHSRPSGSSHPMTSYYGLRNYYWYVWQLYPASEIFFETLHRTGYHLKLWRQGHLSGQSLLKGTYDALRGAWYPLRHRQPISKTTLLYVKWVRRHGCWYGIAPEVRPFDIEL